jgi:hypothetical protein
MREIVTPQGSVYCTVEVKDGKLTFTLREGYKVVLDAKIIPQLKQILNEADFLKLSNDHTTL